MLLAPLSSDSAPLFGFLIRYLRHSALLVMLLYVRGLNLLRCGFGSLPRSIFQASTISNSAMVVAIMPE
jgi:hypothetical protein